MVSWPYVRSIILLVTFVTLNLIETQINKFSRYMVSIGDLCECSYAKRMSRLRNLAADRLDLETKIVLAL